MPENNLFNTLRDLAKLMADNNYINQLLNINTNINDMAEIN